MAPKLPIYMDNHATTPVDARVLDAMLPYFREDFGNAASRSHVFGWNAERAVEQAREQVAAVIGASGREIVWTSGATESDNLAIKGAAEFYRDRGNHIITAVTEHKAVLDTCKRLEKSGFEVTYLPVERDGRVNPQAVADALTDRTIVVSIMLANNEVGTINPVAEIGQVVKARGAIFHIDAVQGVGKIPFDVATSHADLVSLSAHKMYGPKGVGALYVRRKPRVRITPIIDGGGHERGMRSGTLNVPGIVGFGKAAEISAARDGRGEQAAAGAARTAAPGHRSAGQQHRVERLARAPAAGQPEHELRLRRRRGADDGAQGRRGVVGVGVHVGFAGAVLRVARHGRARGDGAHVNSFRSRPIQYRGGSRLRDRSGGAKS